MKITDDRVMNVHKGFFFLYVEFCQDKTLFLIFERTMTMDVIICLILASIDIMFYENICFAFIDYTLQ